MGWQFECYSYVSLHGFCADVICVEDNAIFRAWDKGCFSKHRAQTLCLIRYITGEKVDVDGGPGGR
ncbi:MAG TPA: hypothetical protein PKH46_05810 [Candidatus Cryosericum sp.]|nr:hypothetical protein [Candidatus Cryosericum sp.]